MEIIIWSSAGLKDDVNTTSGELLHHVVSYLTIIKPKCRMWKKAEFTLPASIGIKVVSSSQVPLIRSV